MQADSDNARRRRADEFRKAVETKEERKLRSRQQPHFNIWFGLGMMGLVGWSVAVPTVVGVAVGLWLDRITQSRYSWTLMGLGIGVALGCWNAWYWIKRHRPQ